LEFDRVMVLMDDGETRGFLFGYDKLLGAKGPTAADIKNVQEGSFHTHARKAADLRIKPDARTEELIQTQRMSKFVSPELLTCH